MKINSCRVCMLLCFYINFLVSFQQNLKYMLCFHLKKNAVWGWETVKHVLSSCAMLACCEYSTNIKWHWNMNWRIMNHFRELSCQNVLEDPWNVWQIQKGSQDLLLLRFICLSGAWGDRFWFFVWLIRSFC